MIEALKLLSDLLFYFSFVSLFPSFRDDPLLMAAVMTIGFVSAFLNSSRNKVLKAFSILLPLTQLLLIKSSSQLFLMVLVIGYQLVVLVFHGNDIEYDQYRYFFGVEAILVLSLLFICITSSLNNYCLLLFCSLFLLLGVLVLRSKRMGRNIDLQLHVMNGLEILSVVSVTSGITGLFYFLLIHSEKIFEILMFPIALLIRGLIGIFVALSGFFSYFHSEDLPKEESQSVEEIYNEIFNPNQNVTDEVTDASKNFIQQLQRVLLILLAIALILFILYLVYRLVKRFNAAEEEDSYEQGNGMESIKRKRRSRKQKDVGNAEKIRNLYREFLYIARRKGISVKKQTTSKEVLDNKLFADNPDAAILREIYIRVRYHSDYQVSDEDLQKARECLERLRES